MSQQTMKIYLSLAVIRGKPWVMATFDSAESAKAARRHGLFVVEVDVPYEKADTTWEEAPEIPPEAKRAEPPWLLFGRDEKPAA